MSEARRVSYFYDAEIGNYHYGQGHPMKPHRVRMTHNLVVNYGLYKKMEVFRPHPVSPTAMTRFHSDNYINFLRVITPDSMQDYVRQLQRFNVGEDCPVFDGLFEFCQLYTSGSIGGAARLNENRADIVINWAGGLHHAKKAEASGFCYVNDCVLAILELLKKHERVLYVDIDIHHGDGVEEAFYATNRVMTCSFHKFGEYFPGTGDVLDIGYAEGKNYAINFPLNDGMDDESFESIFRPVVGKIMEMFSPGAVVMQCGADSLSGDRLGCFNLSVKGHAACVEYVRSFHIPMLVLGGGGYTLRHVPRCWTYETSVLVGEPAKDELPFNDYFEYFGPDYRIHLPVSNMENLNSIEYLDRTKNQLLDILREVEPVPGTQIQTGQVDSQLSPRGVQMEVDQPAPEEENPDQRVSQEDTGRKEHPSELAASPSASWEHDNSMKSLRIYIFISYIASLYAGDARDGITEETKIRSLRGNAHYYYYPNWTERRCVAANGPEPHHLELVSLEECCQHNFSGQQSCLEGVGRTYDDSAEPVVADQGGENHPLVAIDGSWSEWSPYSKCCDGIQIRSRTCTNPFPANRGRLCQGKPVEQQACPNQHPCNGAAYYPNWSERRCVADRQEPRSQTLDTLENCCKKNFSGSELESCLKGATSSQESSTKEPILPDPDPSETADNTKPIKLFIMLGQSNMLGYGTISGNEAGTLETLTKDGKYPHLVNDVDGSWTVRKDVVNVWRNSLGKDESSYLTVGEGVDWGTPNDDYVGPELQFGHIIGHVLEEPVLILKVGTGNRAMGWDFLPPGSDRYEFDGKTYAGYGECPSSWTIGSEPGTRQQCGCILGKECNVYWSTPDMCIDENCWCMSSTKCPRWYAGYQYDRDLENAQAVLKNLKDYFPGYRGKQQGYEIAGFVFWQGQKDRGTTAWAQRYEENLVKYIKQPRSDFKDHPGGATAKFVLATIAFDGCDESKWDSDSLAIWNAQLSVSGETGMYPEFADNVKAVDARTFWRDSSESPCDIPYHYNCNAQTYMEVGNSLGWAMADLLQNETRLEEHNCTKGHEHQ